MAKPCTLKLNEKFVIRLSPEFKGSRIVLDNHCDQAIEMDHLLQHLLIIILSDKKFTFAKIVHLPMDTFIPEKGVKIQLFVVSQYLLSLRSTVSMINDEPRRGCDHTMGSRIHCMRNRQSAYPSRGPSISRYEKRRSASRSA